MDEAKDGLNRETQATLLLAGLVTSGLFVLAATVLWGAFLIAASLELSILRNNGYLGTLLGILTVFNALIFYLWGINGLRHSVNHLRRITGK